MEVARDLQDHQLVDRDDRPCGRIDDVLIEWDDNGARLGAILSGGGILVDQLGAFGRLLKRVPRLESARSHIAIEWRQVRAVEQDRVCLLPPRERLGVRRRSHDPRRLERPLTLNALLQLRVIDSLGSEIGILDLRTDRARPPLAPRVTGLLCAPDPKLVLLGLKRHDGGLLPHPRAARQARFAPWTAIASIDRDSIHLDTPIRELPRLIDTPDEAPSPPDSQEGE
jgi:sporulation protein YlmC with PRC-barrel domain